MNAPAESRLYLLEYPADFGIDWLSRSYPVATINATADAGADKQRLRRLVGVDGEQLTAAHMYGYVGFRAGGSFVGRKSEGKTARRIEILSSQTARNADVIPLSSKVNVNRIDVQATLLLDGSFKSIAEASVRVNKEIQRILEHLLMFKKSKEKPVWLSRLKITTIKGMEEGDGETIYIGSRSSDCFIRIYNKTAESRIVAADLTSPALLRIEVELKDSYAISAYSYLVDCGSMAKQADLGDVLNQFTSRVGIQLKAVPFRPFDFLKRAVLSRDNERTLKWLEHTVKPTIERLMVDVGVETVAKALGASIMSQLGLFSDADGSTMVTE